VAKVLEGAAEARANGSTRYCMGAAWREVKDDANFDAVLDMVRGVKGLGMEVVVEPRNRRAGGHKVTLKFQAVQEKDDPTHWKLPTGNLGDTRTELPSLSDVSREMTRTSRDSSAPVELPT